MYYASKIGLKKVYERICYYHEQHRKFISSLHSNFINREYVLIKLYNREYVLIKLYFYKCSHIFILN